VIADLIELQENGQLADAEQGYLAILRNDPEHLEALHWLGVLYVQQNQLTEARDCFEKAIQLAPDNPTFTLLLANTLKIQGLYTQAAQLLENILTIYPEHALALNNLGTVYYARAKLDDAISFYQRAITACPDYSDAYYNLGLALSKKNLFAEAIATYRTLLEITPDHFPARFHLACILMNQEDILAATSEFLKIAEIHPYHFETQMNLATCYLKQDLLNSAKHHYEQALALTSEDTQLLFNLGVIMMQQGHVDSAIQYYQRAIKINPDFFDAHNNLGVAFLAKQHVNFALNHFQEALQIQPNNQAIAYTVSMLSQNQPLLTAPPEYIKTLFDAYADHYDVHLLKNLDYHLPTLFQEAISVVLQQPQAKLAIADLGCGTGLCGAVLKPYAKTLTGVDLSEKMLAIAKQKSLYDELVNTDFVTFLQDKKSSFDLIVAGDALVYSGDLDIIFKMVSIALRPQGLFVFNTEITELDEYKMSQSGRFLHNKHYLEQLSARYHLQPVFYEVAATRTQNNEPVYGHIYVLKL
jgi:predicted TPR repeat methyltransferase